jgi:hypothetical protein
MDSRGAEFVVALAELPRKNCPLKIMSWNHRIVAEEVGGETTYRIHEVFYDDTGRPASWTEDPVMPCGDSVHAIRYEYDLMRLAFFRAVLRVQSEGERQFLERDAAGEAAIDDFHRHEALDRTSIFADQFESHVASHPVIELDPELRFQANEIIDRLAALYQAVGRLAKPTNEESSGGGG